MKNYKFSNVIKMRRKLLNDNKNVDSIFIKGNSNVLISVPHGVSQTRLGKYKFAEIGTVSVGKLVADETQANLLIKTKNNFDDANYDVNCLYRKKLYNIIKKHNIKYVIDLHGLAIWRECEINLGTNLGKNIENDQKIFNQLNKMLLNNFNVVIDNPYMASGNTISACVKRDFNIWTIQIEINCGITNLKEKIDKFNILVDTLCNWVNLISQNKK